MRKASNKRSSKGDEQTGKVDERGRRRWHKQMKRKVGKRKKNKGKGKKSGAFIEKTTTIM